MAESKEKSIFDILNAVNVSDKTEKKNGLTYLSWAWAWGEVKKRFPSTSYTVIKNEEGCIYHTDGRTAWVEVEVNINDLTQREILPIMDYRNNSIPLDKVTSMDAVRSIQRAVTKCIGRFGLGLYIYAGEDLPEEETVADASQTAQKASRTAKKEQEVKQPIMEIPDDFCTICRLPVMDYNGKKKNGEPVEYKKQDIIAKSIEMYGSPVCMACMLKKAKAEKGGKA